MSKFRNWIYILLLGLIFFEVLVVFPKKISSLKNVEPKSSETKSGDDLTIRPSGSIDGKSSEKTNNVANSHPKEDPKITEAKLNGQQRLQGVHLVESQKGRRDWELFSDVAEGNQGQGSWSLNKIKVLFYRGDKVSFTVTGDAGKIDAKTKNLSFSGNVSTVSENGYSFQTNTIQYISENRSLLSPDDVKMFGPRDAKGEGLIVKGKRMLSFVDESRMIIQQDVRAEKEVSPGAKMNLTSATAEFSGKNKEASFDGQVRMTYQDMEISGDRVSFLYSSGADILSTMKVNGSVRLKQKDRLATSERLNLDLLKNQFTFQGHPRLTQADDIITGEEIVFLDGGKKVKVEKIQAKIENQKK